MRGAGRARGAGAKLPFRVEVLIARLLLWGGLVSVALVLIGLVVYAAHGGFAHHVIDLRQRAPTGRAGHPPDVFVSLAEVLHGLTARPRDPLALVALGLVLLLMTPVLGAALAILGFIVSRDYRYAIIASIVFAMLVVSVVLAGGAG